MAFLSSFWLLALVPWAILAAWVLRGRRVRVKIPFLDLWRGPLPLEIPRRGWRWPPVWLGLILAAILLAVLAAAQPAIRSSKLGSGQPLVLIIDRGMSMSAMVDGVPRFRKLSEDVNKQLNGNVWSLAEVRVRTVPGDVRPATFDNWLGIVSSEPMTATDTHELLAVAVQEELSQSQGPVLVISDQALHIDSDRLIQIGPAEVPADIAITHLAARAAPIPQIMVRLRNDSARASAKVRVASGEWSQDRAVDLPARGRERDYFFDPPALADTIEARLLDADDQPANDRRWLAREGSNPRIEMRAPLPPELVRIIDVFARNRPPSDESTRVAVVTGIEQLPQDAPGIVLAALPAVSSAPAAPVVASHPITKDVNWQALAGEIRVAADDPAGWQPLVSAEGKTMVAVKEAPVRQVWVGFDAAGWSSTTDFVIFWANVFSWTGAAEPHFAGHLLADFHPDWELTNPPALTPAVKAGQWPGIYRSPDKSMHAINAPDVKGQALSSATWRSKLQDAQRQSRAGNPLAVPLLIAAMVAIVGACATWKRESTQRSAATG